MNTILTIFTLLALLVTPIMLCLPSWLGSSDVRDVAPAVESWYDYDFHFGFAQYHADDCRCGRKNTDNYSRLLADDDVCDEYDDDSFINSFVVKVTRHTRDEFASRDRFPKHVSKSKEVK